MIADSFCKVQLCGFTGADAEIKPYGTNQKCVILSIAVTQRTFDQEKKCFRDSTEWQKAQAFGKLAEELKTIRKGTRMLIFGHLHNWRFENQWGRPDMRARIIIEQYSILREPVIRTTPPPPPQTRPVFPPQPVGKPVVASRPGDGDESDYMADFPF
jgi:single-stranded DNA-binding protein